MAVTIDTYQNQPGADDVAKLVNLINAGLAAENFDVTPGQFQGSVNTRSEKAGPRTTMTSIRIDKNTDDAPHTGRNMIDLTRVVHVNPSRLAFSLDAGVSFKNAKSVAGPLMEMVGGRDWAMFKTPGTTAAKGIYAKSWAADRWGVDLRGWGGASPGNQMNQWMLLDNNLGVYIGGRTGRMWWGGNIDGNTHAPNGRAMIIPAGTTEANSNRQIFFGPMALETCPSGYGGYQNNGLHIVRYENQQQQGGTLLRHESDRGCGGPFPGGGATPSAADCADCARRGNLPYGVRYLEAHCIYLEDGNTVASIVPVCGFHTNHRYYDLHAVSCLRVVATNRKNPTLAGGGVTDVKVNGVKVLTGTTAQTQDNSGALATSRAIAELNNTITGFVPSDVTNVEWEYGKRGDGSDIHFTGGGQPTPSGTRNTDLTRAFIGSEYAACTGGSVDSEADVASSMDPVTAITASVHNANASATIAHSVNPVSAITASVHTSYSAAVVSSVETATDVIGAVSDHVGDIEFLIAPASPSHRSTVQFVVAAATPGAWRWQVDDGPVILGRRGETVDALAIPAITPGSHTTRAWQVINGIEGPPAEHTWTTLAIQPPPLPASPRLGTGVYSVWLMDRLGRQRVSLLAAFSVAWTRRRKTTTTASVQMTSSSDPACNLILANVKSWAYSIGIWRGDTLVWEGPAVDGNYSTGVLNGRDVSAWLGRRRLRTAQHHAGIDAALVIRDYIREALRVDPFGITVQIQSEAGRLITRDVAANTRLAAAEIDEVAKSGVEWTMHRRAFQLGVPPGVVCVLDDAAFTEPPEIMFDGLSITTDAVVLGVGTDDVALVGTAQAVHPDIEQGVHDALSTASEAEGFALNDQAAALISYERVAIGEGVLSPNAPVDITQLVPGARFDLRLVDGAKKITGIYQLETVDASASPSQAEAVKVSFTPA